MPEELWTQARDIVQEIVIKIIHKKKKKGKKKKCKKANRLSAEALQIAEKRREAKGKGEKERYTHLNAEFPRIARRDKKGFLSDQCKELEENNRMGKTRDLYKKIRDTKPTSAGSSKKQESFRKTSISALLTIPKPLTVWTTTNWKILQEI